MGVKGLEKFVQMHGWGKTVELQKWCKDFFEQRKTSVSFVIDGGSVS